MDSILQSKDTSSLLYASEISLDVCRQQMLVFVPKIYEFIQHYIKGIQIHVFCYYSLLTNDTFRQ